jgi:hypothetical protein
MYIYFTFTTVHATHNEFSFFSLCHLSAFLDLLALRTDAAPFSLYFCLFLCCVFVDLSIFSRVPSSLSLWLTLQIH